VDNLLIITTPVDDLSIHINGDQQRVKMKRHIQRGVLLVLLVAAAILLSSAASGLNQGYLVPSGNTRIDQQLLKTPLKICALTFDDGPDARYTMQVHDILRQEEIRASFFVVGRNVDRYPEQVMALAEYGHEICNHSYTHRDMLKLSKADITKELKDSNAILAKLGITPRWFRPPYGSFNRTVVDLAADHGLDTMLWSVDPQDWMRPGSAAIQQRVLNGAAPGSVILLHSTVSQTIEALPAIIAGLRKDGYSFVTVSEWQQLVSGNLSLENLGGTGNTGKAPLQMPELPGMGAQSGILSTGLSGDSDVWQRVPAGRPGKAERRLTVYANFVDDIDLQRVLSEGRAHNLIQADSTVGQGLLRVLDGLPPQQIVAVVDQQGVGRHARDSVEVQVHDTQVDLGSAMLASAAQEATDAAVEQVPAGADSSVDPELQSSAEAQPEGALPAIRMAEAAGPVSLGGGTALSVNLASAEYASSAPMLDDTSIVFVSYATSPDAAEWRGLKSYMQLCSLSGFGYARGYATGKAPTDFPFGAGFDQEGRQRLELGMFNPVKFLQSLDDNGKWFIPLRSSDLQRLAGERLFEGVSNGFREFMLIRHFTAGLTRHGQNKLPGLADGQYACSFSSADRQVLVIAAPRPGIDVAVPQIYQDWQRIRVDGNGRLDSASAGSRASAEGRVLILVQDSSD
jgi:peptidoglycan/xylan/chitin deacetylase (PgdA/CDA1 family)